MNEISKNPDILDFLLSKGQYMSVDLVNILVRIGGRIMNGIGLVLAGGGGKGAYEIGVWKYLREIGLDKEIVAVSGTSVGALNAAMFASGSYEKAETIWKNIRKEQILELENNSITKIIEWLSNNMILDKSLSVGSIGYYASILSHALVAPFTREGLVELIREGINFNELKKCKIPCYVTCARLSNGIDKHINVEKFQLNYMLKENMETILLASSAIPLLFEPVTYRGSKYIDGGIPLWGQNVPINPIIEMDIKDIIVVHLNKNEKTNKRKYPGCNIIDIYPSVDMGKMKDGILNFDAERACENINIGYFDAERILRKELAGSWLNYKFKLKDNNKSYSKVRIVKTKRELEAALKDKEVYFEVEGDIVKELRLSKTIAFVEKAIITYIFASYAIATITSPISAGTSYAIATGVVAPIAISSGISASSIVAAWALGVATVTELFSKYAVEFKDGRALFTLKNAV